MKIMSTTTFLTSISILIILGTFTQFAFAQIISDYDHSHTLKEVLQDREIGDPITCPNPAHVLVLRSNNNWACVYFETAKHLNWDIVLYSVPDAPQITTSIFYHGDYHYITYQTNEEVVDSVEFPSASEGTNEGYVLEISITPTHKGDLTVILPSIESDMFENYCTEQGAIPDSHFFFYLIDGVEVGSEETDVEFGTKVKLHYNADSKMIEIILGCLI